MESTGKIKFAVCVNLNVQIFCHWFINILIKPTENEHGTVLIMIISVPFVHTGSSHCFNTCVQTKTKQVRASSSLYAGPPDAHREVQKAGLTLVHTSCPEMLYRQSETSLQLSNLTQAPKVWSHS